MSASLPPEGNTEIAELAERVSALRQELETVEARLRGISHGLPETVDVPTVLTTNPALRHARRQSILLVTSAAGILAAGILVGVLIGRPSTPVASTAAPAMTTQATAMAPPPSPLTLPTPTPTPTPTETAVATAPPQPAPPPTVAATAEAKKTGSVTITTTPSARVMEGDRVLGHTPLVKELSPGDHTLLLEGADGQKKTVRLTVAAGESYNFRYTMDRLDRGF